MHPVLELRAAILVAQGQKIFRDVIPLDQLIKDLTRAGLATQVTHDLDHGCEVANELWNAIDFLIM